MWCIHTAATPYDSMVGLTSIMMIITISMISDHVTFQGIWWKVELGGIIIYNADLQITIYFKSLIDSWSIAYYKITSYWKWRCDIAILYQINQTVLSYAQYRCAFPTWIRIMRSAISIQNSIQEGEFPISRVSVLGELSIAYLWLCLLSTYPGCWGNKHTHTGTMGETKTSIHSQ